MENDEIQMRVEEQSGFKHFFKRILFGFLYGLAIVIPGISGAAIALIFKIYDELIYSFSHLFSKKFKSCFLYLLPVLLGLVLGFILGFFAIQKLLDLIPFSLVLLFLGLMIGSFPLVLTEIKGNEKSTKNTLAFILGALIPIVILIVTIAFNFSSLKDTAIGIENNSDPSAFFQDYPWYLFLASLPIGAIMGLTQVAPGLSASAFLMMIGWYKPILNAVSIDYIKENPLFIVLVLIMILGFALGFIFTSKFIEWSSKKNRTLTYQVIVGLSLGSLVTMLFNPEMITIYLSWYYNGIQNTAGIVDLSLALPLLSIGVISSYLLVRYQKKKAR